MHFTKKNASEKRSNFIESLKSGKLLRFPGAYNPLSAKLISEIGFDGVYISGGVMANDLGLPDIGLTTLEQVSYRASQITRVTDLPTIVDADTGFKDCKKTISTLETKGLAGCHIEDQIEQKRCGHLDNKELISKEEMVIKIKNAVIARTDKNFLIIVRTDANAVEGIDKTLDRIKAYEDAGADMIFPEALNTIEQYREFSDSINVPILANITEFGQTPLFTKEELSDAGVDMILYPLSAFRAMSKAALNVYQHIIQDGHQNNVIESMQTREELYDFLNYHQYEKQLDDEMNKESK